MRSPVLSPTRPGRPVPNKPRRSSRRLPALLALASILTAAPALAATGPEMELNLADKDALAEDHFIKAGERLTLTQNNEADAVITGDFSGPEGATLIFGPGPGAVTLGGDNTGFAGQVVLNGSTVVVSSRENLFKDLSGLSFGVSWTDRLEFVDALAHYFDDPTEADGRDAFQAAWNETVNTLLQEAPALAVAAGRLVTLGGRGLSDPSLTVTENVDGMGSLFRLELQTGARLIIQNHQASEAVKVNGGALALISDGGRLTFLNNHNDSGNGSGVITADFGALVVQGADFVNNVSSSYASGAVGLGNYAAAELTDVRFIGNSSGHGGAISVDSCSSLSLARGLLAGNVNREGGAIANDGVMSLDSLVMAANLSKGFGGAISSTGPTLNLGGPMVFVNNQADESGGAVNVNGGMVNLRLIDGQTALFAGNTGGGAGNSFFLNESTLSMKLGELTLTDLRDPLGGTGATIEQNGGWLKLGGESVLTEGSQVTVIEGTLHLYRADEGGHPSGRLEAGQIALADDGIFSLTGHSTLSVGGGNGIEAGSIQFGAGKDDLTTLSFDLGAAGSVGGALLTLRGGQGNSVQPRINGAIQIDLKSLSSGDGRFTLIEGGGWDLPLEKGLVKSDLTLRGEKLEGTRAGELGLALGAGDDMVIASIMAALILKDLPLVITQSAGVQNQVLTWTGGADEKVWNITADNLWSVGENSIKFLHGDLVNFSLAEASSQITLNSEGDGTVQVAGLYFSGDGDYQFRGRSITADGENGTSLNNTEAANGKLVLGRQVGGEAIITDSGFTGRVNLTETVANDFRGGVELYGGALVIADAAQLGTGLDGLRFLGSRESIPVLETAEASQVTFAGGRDAAWGSLVIDSGKYGRIDLGENSVLNLVDNQRSNAGGAIFINDGHLMLSGAEGSEYVFSSNKALKDNDGGAIALAGRASLELSAAAFLGNYARSGGAISVQGQATLNLNQRATFTANRASADGGALHLSLEPGTQARLVDADFIGNIAEGRGGAIYLEPGQLTLAVSEGRTSVFTGNTQGENKTANSIWLGGGEGKGALIMDVAKDGWLEMSDPLGGELKSGGWSIAKTGRGIWKLGGQNVLTGEGAAVSLEIKEGGLHLAHEASIEVSAGQQSFKLTSAGTLISSGRNLISMGGEGGSIEIGAGAGLGFDLRKFGEDRTGLTLEAKTITLAAETINLTGVKTGEWRLITSHGDFRFNAETEYALTLKNKEINLEESRYLYDLAVAESRADSGELDLLKLTVTLNGQNKNLIWRGGAEAGDHWADDGLTANWVDAAKPGSPALGFAAGDYVIFDARAGAEHRSIVITDDDLVVAGMKIEGGVYSFSGGNLVSTIKDVEIIGDLVEPDYALTLSGKDTVAKFSTGLNFEQGIAITNRAQLVLNDGAGLASGQTISLSENSILTFNQNEDYVFTAASLSGEGGLMTKTGTGLLTLKSGEGQTDFSGFEGGLEIQAGTLEVKGNLGPGITVKALGGGDRNGALIIGDGGSLGNLVIESGTLLAKAGSGALTVTGGLKGLNTAQFKVGPADWEIGKDYTLLTADTASLAGFQTVSGESLLDSWTISAADSALTLHINHSRTLSGLFQGHSLSGVAGALTDLGADDQLYQLVGSLETKEQAAEALESLTGSLQTAAPASALSYDGRVAAGTVSRHLSGLISNWSGPGAQPPSFGQGDDNPHRLWFSYGYNRTRYGQRTSTLKGPEAWLGYDRNVGENWLVGGALRFARQDLKNTDGKSDIQSLGAALYAGRAFHIQGPGTPRLSFGLIGTHHDLDTDRVVQVGAWRDTLTSQRHGRTWQAFVQGAWAFEVYDWLEVAPYLNVSWTHSRVSGTTEDGGLAALKLSKQSDSNAATTLGVRLETAPTERVSLGLSLGWSHVYGDVDRAVSVGFDSGGRHFNSEGPQMARDILETDLRLSAQFNDRLGASLQYEGGFGDDYRRHAGSITVDTSW